MLSENKASLKSLHTVFHLCYILKLTKWRIDELLPGTAQRVWWLCESGGRAPGRDGTGLQLNYYASHTNLHAGKRHSMIHMHADEHTPNR